MRTKNLAKNVKKLRSTRAMSQEYLADESRVSLRTIQRIENSESEPTGETIKRIAIALDVELIELIGSNYVAETSDLKGTIIFLQKQLSKTNDKSEVKTFEKFIGILQNLKEKDLTTEQRNGIESYLQYLELEKIPSFSNEMFQHKLTKFRKYLKNKLRFVPKNYYTTWATSFGFSFAVAFAVQKNIDYRIKIGMVSMALLIIGIGIILDMRMKRQERTFSF